MSKYKTLAELKQAYESFEIPGRPPLRIDNDCASVRVAKCEHETERVYYFEGTPEELLYEALDLLGIPNEPE